MHIYIYIYGYIFSPRFENCVASMLILTASRPRPTASFALEYVDTYIDLFIYLYTYMPTQIRELGRVDAHIHGLAPVAHDAHEPAHPRLVVVGAAALGCIVTARIKRHIHIY